MSPYVRSYSSSASGDQTVESVPERARIDLGMGGIQLSPRVFEPPLAWSTAICLGSAPEDGIFMVLYRPNRAITWAG